MLSEVGALCAQVFIWKRLILIEEAEDCSAFFFISRQAESNILSLYMLDQKPSAMFAKPHKTAVGTAGDKLKAAYIASTNEQKKKKEKKK